MLTIENIEKSLLDSVITMVDESYWKVVKVYATNFQYRIDVEEVGTNRECWFSLIRVKPDPDTGYILYSYIDGKKLKSINLTNQTLSTPKDFLFQLECSLTSILMQVPF